MKPFTPQRTREGYDRLRKMFRGRCRDPGIDLTQYRILGYLCGDRVDKLAGLSWTEFETVRLIAQSTNPKNKLTRYHFLAKRYTRRTVIVAEKIT